MSEGYEKSKSAGNERTRKIEDLILRSKVDSGLSAPGDRELQLIGASWAELLEPVATDWLNECYVRAMRGHDPAQPFKAAEVFKAWQLAVASGEFDRSRINVLPALTQGERRCYEYGCSFEGWVTVNGDGTLWTGGVGQTYARACPIHRPQGWAVGDITKENYRGPNRY
jgi:hypothetical protein